MPEVIVSFHSLLVILTDTVSGVQKLARLAEPIGLGRRTVLCSHDDELSGYDENGSHGRCRSWVHCANSDVVGEVVRHRCGVCTRSGVYDPAEHQRLDSHLAPS